MTKRLTKLAALGIIVGGSVGFLAVGFVETILWLNDTLRLTSSSTPTQAGRTALFLTIPAIGGLAVGLIRSRMQRQQFLGPADVISAAQDLDSKMPVRQSLWSAGASILSLGSGASVGQYGPLVHIGSSFASWIDRLSKSDGSFRKIALASGAAAAIAAAFHAPIAGLVFSREVILRHHSLRAFAPIAVAATSAYVVAHIVLRRTPFLQPGDIGIVHAYEYLVFIAIGLGGAVVASAYMHAIDLSASLARRLPLPGPIKTALAGLALGITALLVPDILGMGQDLLSSVLNGQAPPFPELLAIFVAKLVMTAICLGFGFAGGVFSPALLIGALYGALMGSGVELALADQQSPLPVYAVCGLVAVVSPVIGAPLTAILIVFELTQNYDLATVAMISAAFANFLGSRLYGRSFFDVQLQQRGIDLSQGRDKVTAQQHTVDSLIERDYTRAAESQTLAEIRDLLVTDRRSEAYVVSANGAYVGTISLQRLLELINKGTQMSEIAADHASPESIVLSPDTSIWTAMTSMDGFFGESIPVVEDDRMVGVLYESAIVGAYLGVLADIRQEEHASI